LQHACKVTESAAANSCLLPWAQPRTAARIYAASALRQWSRPTLQVPSDGFSSCCPYRQPSPARSASRPLACAAASRSPLPRLAPPAALAGSHSGSVRSRGSWVCVGPQRAAAVGRPEQR
jgi:hypothetical protein